MAQAFLLKLHLVIQKAVLVLCGFRIMPNIQFDGGRLPVKNYFFFLIFCGYVFKYLKKTLEKYDGEL